MRKVKIKKWIDKVIETPEGKNYQTKVKGTGCFEKEFSTNGFFHVWGVNYEEFEDGVGSYTMAIIELLDGTITEVLPNNIKFI